MLPLALIRSERCLARRKRVSVLDFLFALAFEEHKLLDFLLAAFDADSSMAGVIRIGVARANLDYFLVSRACTNFSCRGI
jgi:hypothetical protein